MDTLRIAEVKQETITTETVSLIEPSVAPNTIKTYRSALKKLKAWLDGRSVSDNRLATYITQLHRDGKSPATISLVVAAVKWETRRAGPPQSVFPLEITDRTLVGIRQEGRNRGRGQVDGITWAEVERVCELAEADNTTTGLRDSALIRLMSDCLLRISEAVAVDIEDVDSVLTIHQSKAFPGGGRFPDATLYIGTPTREGIRRYCEAGGITAGPLFRRIRRGDHITGSRLSVVGARDAIKRRASAAGVEGFISGHSLRVGSAVSLAQAGASVVDMQVAGRWKSPQMPAHYARAELVEQGAIARFKYGKQ